MCDFKELVVDKIIGVEVFDRNTNELIAEFSCEDRDDAESDNN